MSVSLPNTKDIFDTALYLVQSNGPLEHKMDIMGDIEGELTPEQLQTISAISNAINIMTHVLQHCKIKCIAT